MKNSDRDHQRGHFSGTQVLLYLLLVVVGAGAAFMGDRWLRANGPLSLDSLDPRTPSVTTPDDTPRGRGVLSLPVNSNFIVEAVEKVGPAVVRIDAARTVTQDIPDAFRDPFFRRFFGQTPMEPQQRMERGTGSGFIISDDGKILTNAHVINGADTVSVVLRDGRIFEGTVLGEDSISDVAVVKIEATELPKATLGNSEQLQPGEWAIAIGNPLGLDNSVTVGIVSATGRSSRDVGVPDKRVGFIQTDAAINPGNSGGPLLNARGEVIGMNTAIISGAQGLGFAIPIQTAQAIAQQLITTGKVLHPFLGIEMVTITSELQEELNTDPNSPMQLSVNSGVLIVRVAPNSPAERAGLREGDVIQRMENQAIAQSDVVQQIVQGSQVGNSLELQINRDGQTLNITVQPGEMPANPSF
ncbi:trypsin-like peptidase domain-containing protein [Phormidium pseudopriestleyi FRX01]|uniref:Trypsin-like peptidase domain-containing protein n=1 Tax=Phormidium pseudopriestleyi FRX01 TaxID=1759528 RepID=A0ABS3FYP4_9CYAN|nr:HhoA/HhoB/HtrA family serine endopeptidase [Phormidium pseudopriestleyi]MBO0352236.1 trypsin-like peptidase domain-containing protein [Phormidium pseudopriestleyi FRX01]